MYLQNQNQNYQTGPNSEISKVEDFGYQSIWNKFQGIQQSKALFVLSK